MTPKRIQRKRTKGWKMPEDTIYVGRPTKWGNPHRTKDVIAALKNHYMESFTFPATEAQLIAEQDWRTEAMHLYRDYIIELTPAEIEELVRELRGKNLACWCPLDQPCHADVLLELANSPVQEE